MPLRLGLSQKFLFEFINLYISLLWTLKEESQAEIWQLAFVLLALHARLSDALSELWNESVFTVLLGRVATLKLEPGKTSFMTAVHVLSVFFLFGLFFFNLLLFLLLLLYLLLLVQVAICFHQIDLFALMLFIEVSLAIVVGQRNQAFSTDFISILIMIWYLYKVYWSLKGCEICTLLEFKGKFCYLPF